ncbi:hypothetical protein [Streptomyces sp. NPDC057694]|uniref:hypothetical protein n=1 Tax=Streptomyces sp. NPDC057694 TaxID=3346216 RepID=UPI0036B33B32
MMRLLLRRAVMGGVAFVAALGVSATSASATGSGVWTVSPGGNYTGTGTNPLFTWGSTTFNCGSSSVSGYLSPTDADGLAAGTFLPAYASCNIAGIPFTYSSGPTPWKINFLQRNAANPSRVDLSITGVTLNWSATGCHVSWSGTLYGQYDNATGQLSTGLNGAPAGQVVAGAGASCLGLVVTGDVLTIKATYTLTPKQTITPPA